MDSFKAVMLFVIFVFQGAHEKPHAICVRFARERGLVVILKGGKKRIAEILNLKSLVHLEKLPSDAF